jgi:hypothetical protein
MLCTTRGHRNILKHPSFSGGVPEFLCKPYDAPRGNTTSVVFLSQHGGDLFRMGGVISELLFLRSELYERDLYATKYNIVKNKNFTCVANFLFYVYIDTQMGFQEYNTLAEAPGC